MFQLYVEFCIRGRSRDRNDTQKPLAVYFWHSICKLCPCIIRWIKCVCACVIYVHVFFFVCVSIYVLKLYTHTHTRTYIYIYMNVCMYIYIRVCVCVMRAFGCLEAKQGAIPADRPGNCPSWTSASPTGTPLKVTGISWRCWSMSTAKLRRALWWIWWTMGIQKMAILDSETGHDHLYTIC